MAILFKVADSGFNWDSFTGDDFTGTNGDPPNPVVWLPEQPYESEYVTIQNNKLNCNVTNTEIDSRTYGEFTLSGDFDVQVDYDVVTETQSSLNPLLLARILLANAAETRWFSIGRRMDTLGGGDTKLYEIIQNDESPELPSTTHDSGKLRITRTGSTLKCYIWSGSQWEWEGNPAGYTYIQTSSDDLRPRLDFRSHAGGGAVNSNIDNFLINSGTVVAP